MTNKVAVVTGANSGLGFELTKSLLANGMTVVMACRRNPLNSKKVQALNSENLFFIQLDLSDIKSIEKFVIDFKNKFSSLHLLVNNAGIMNPPFSLTKQGFESQFGVNYLGHYILTRLLLPLLGKVNESRIVNVSSLTADKATIDFNSFKSDINYHLAYGQSKLALLLFTNQLSVYLKDQNHPSIVLSAHPGYARTNLQKNVNGLLRKLHVKYLQLRFAQPSSKGALPILKAISTPNIMGGEYFGPNENGGLKGEPVQISYPKAAMNTSLAEQLWEYSERQMKANL